MMKAWIGKSMLVIGTLHSVFGFVVFRGVLAEIVQEGFFNTVDMQPDRNAAFWFLFGGFMVLIIGGLTDWAERKGMALPAFLMWSILIITVLGCIIMPKSGFWLMIVPVAGLWIRRIHHGKRYDPV